MILEAPLTALESAEEADAERPEADDAAEVADADLDAPDDALAEEDPADATLLLTMWVNCQYKLVFLREN